MCLALPCLPGHPAAFPLRDQRSGYPPSSRTRPASLCCPMTEPMSGPVFAAAKAASDLIDRTHGRALTRDEKRLMARYADRLIAAAQQAVDQGDESTDDSQRTEGKARDDPRGQ